jgi:hypothetical protein
MMRKPIDRELEFFDEPLSEQARANEREQTFEIC